MNAVRTDEETPPPCTLCEQSGHQEDQCPLREPTDALLRAAAQAGVDMPLLTKIVARRISALQEEAARPVCVAIVVQDPEGRVLAVERADVPGQIGLVGGKIEAGETPEQAARRELREETGLRAHRLRLLLTGPSLPANTRPTACFEATFYDGEPQSRETPVSWVSWQELTDPGRSPFFLYNERVRLAIEAGVPR